MPLLFFVTDRACQHVSSIEGINARYLFSYLTKSRWLGSSPVEDGGSHIACDFLRMKSIIHIVSLTEESDLFSYC